MCTSESDSDDAFQPEIIMDLTELIIYRLCYLREKIKIGVTGKYKERHLKVYVNTEVCDPIFGGEEYLETLNPKSLTQVMNVVFFPVKCL